MPDRILFADDGFETPHIPLQCTEDYTKATRTRPAQYTPVYAKKIKKITVKRRPKTSVAGTGGVLSTEGKSVRGTNSGDGRPAEFAAQ